ARREWTGEAADPDEVENELTLLGIVGILDPPREGAEAAVRSAHAAGIRVIMITGDAMPTARAIAARVHVPTTRALTGPQVDALTDDELRGVLCADDVLFARTAPEHKLRIVRALQASGHVVGMTGDGVNDAPALEQADIGIAMGRRGTDVAKGAADIVLSDDDFASIVGAIEEGRRQYDNIQKFVRFLLATNVGEVVAICGNLVVGGPLILVPAQILWMNLVTDGVSAIALGIEPAERDVMHRPPRSVDSKIVDGSAAIPMLVLGTYMGLMTLALFETHRGPSAASHAHAQTMAFAGMILAETLVVFNFRTLHAPLWSIGLFSNPWLIVAWTATIGLQLAAIYTEPMQKLLHTVPLSAQDWMTLLSCVAPAVILFELAKFLRWRRKAR
ncbi:MAG: HAD-IC family P-type ATPase, partial [Planctomycetes bacterium]|nr:HAD-IC family P-type ATPase [Planctomycetota bacterium]